MKHGSIFSGIGGFDLAAEWMGWENVFHCERNTFGQRVLKYYWPKSISYADITKTDFSIHRGTIDVLTGGFPCQPYSLAGKRLGKEDERHLWPEMLRAIREIQPGWVVGENVFGLVNWNGGLVFNEVQTQLEAEGYEVQPFILPACAVNAPHRRDRIWFVAHSASYRREWERQGVEIENRKEEPRSSWELEGRPEGLCDTGNVTNANSINGGSKSQQFGCNREGARTKFAWGNTEDQSERKGLGYMFESPEEYTKWSEHLSSNANVFRLWGQSNRSGKPRFFNEACQANDWSTFPTQSPVCNGNDGFSSRLDFDSVFEGIARPRKANPFGRWRNESIKAGGNAIVPQVAYQIFQTIEAYNIHYGTGK